MQPGTACCDDGRRPTTGQVEDAWRAATGFAEDDDPRRWRAPIALGLNVVIPTLDDTLFFFALPTLAGELGATSGEPTLFVEALVLAFARLLFPA